MAAGRQAVAPQDTEQVSSDAVCARLVGLVDHVNVRRLHDAGLHGLHVITGSGGQDEYLGIGYRANAIGRLSGAYGLDDDLVESEPVERVTLRSLRRCRSARLPRRGSATTG